MGTISGAIAHIPALLIGVLVFGFLLTGFIGGMASGALGSVGLFGGIGILFLLAVGAAGFVYFVGLSAVGGWIGNAIKGDADGF